MCFVFNDTATTEIYTLSLHNALPIFVGEDVVGRVEEAREGAGAVSIGAAVEREGRGRGGGGAEDEQDEGGGADRSGEDTSELQSRRKLVSSLLPEKTNAFFCLKKKIR